MGVWMDEWIDGVVVVVWEVVLVGCRRIEEGKNIQEVNHNLHVCFVSLCLTQRSQRYPRRTYRALVDRVSRMGLYETFSFGLDRCILVG